MQTIVLMEIQPGNVILKQNRPHEFLDVVLDGEAQVWMTQQHWTDAHRNAETTNGVWCILGPALSSLLTAVRASIDGMPSLRTIGYVTAELEKMTTWLAQIQKVWHSLLGHSSSV